MPRKPLRWKKAQVVGLQHDHEHVPTPRSGYTLTMVGVNGYLFGGLDSSIVPPSASDGLFCVRLSEEVCEWKRLGTPINEAAPLARWRHTATQINTTAILFFGGYHTHDERLNDCWIFDTITLGWTRPEPAPEKVDPKAPPAKKKKKTSASGSAAEVYHLPLQEVTRRDVPAPRGGHSATMVGPSHVYLFGGYGGYGYRRGDMDDLHKLDTGTMRWQEVGVTKGTPPEKRSGHQASAVQLKLILCGGKNSTTEFNDLHVLDTSLDPPVWTNYWDALGECRWNFGLRSFMAMPKWRLFAFGGKGRVESEFDSLMGGGGGAEDEEYLNDLLMIDTTSFRVTKPDVKGTPPPGRSDMEIVFDSKHGQLAVFGGYGSEWWDDMWLLDVSAMVGPSYVLKDLYPRKAAVTGGSTLDLIGLDFPNTDDVTVRFEWTDKKEFVDVQGMFDSQSKLTCVVPRLADHETAEDEPPLGQGTCQVRVALDGDSFTLASVEFYFHSITESGSCVMFGPGVLEAARDPANNKLATLEETMFIIQAKDDKGKNRTTGGDEFEVTIARRIEPEDGADEVVWRRVHGVGVEDNEDGTYLVRYTAQEAGEHVVEVKFMGTYGGTPGPIRGSPITVCMDDYAPRANNQFSGKLVLSSLKQDVDDVGAFTENTLEVLSQPIEEGDRRVQKGRWSEKREMQALADVKLRIQKVQDEGPVTDLTLARCACCVSYMKKIGRNVGPLTGVLKQAGKDWVKIRDMIPELEETMRPLIKKNAVIVRRQIAEYKLVLEDFKAEVVAGRTFKQYEVGFAAALHSLEKYNTKNAAENDKCERMLVLANAFNCPRELGEAAQVLRDVQVELDAYTSLWQVDKEVRFLMEMATETLWIDLDPGGLDDLGRSCVKKAKKCPESTVESSAYHGLQEFVRRFQLVCPIVAAFKKPSFQKRHWKDLIFLALPNDPPEHYRNNFKIPEKDPEFLVGQFFAEYENNGGGLALYRVAPLVEALVHKAEAESSHEHTLVALEARWAAIKLADPADDPSVKARAAAELAVKNAKGKKAARAAKAKEATRAAAAVAHSLPVLSFAEPLDLEKLKSDHVMLLDILKSEFERFHAPAALWRERLEAVETMLTLAKENRDATAFLHPLYTKSKEVMRALPKAAARFQALFEDQKKALDEMLALTFAAPAVTGWRPAALMEYAAQKAAAVAEAQGTEHSAAIAAAAAETAKQTLADEAKAAEKLPGGVGGGGGDEGRSTVHAFELFASALEKCLRDLRSYADSKRADFPRFFFLSNRELLDVLANGAEPEKVFKHLPKMFIETEKLDFIPPQPADDPADGGGGDGGDDNGSVRSSGTGATGSSTKVQLGSSSAWAGWGGEIVPFHPEVVIVEGRVEYYLGALLSGTERTLRKRLDESVVRYLGTSKLEWLMAKHSYLPPPPPVDPAAEAAKAKAAKTAAAAAGGGAGNEAKTGEGDQGGGNGEKEGTPAGSGAAAALAVKAGANGADEAAAAAAAATKEASEAARRLNVSVDPGQVTVFVAQWYNMKTLQDAMRSFGNGSEGALITVWEQHVFDLGELGKLIRANLPPLDRVRVGNQIVLDVFHRDTIALIAKNQLVDTQSFIWQAYLKPEYAPPASSGGGNKKSEADDEKAHVAYTALGMRVMYGFMYCSGAVAMPVLTAASDRGRLALMRALVHGGPSGMGACVAGPRGSGKSSLVTSTAATLGRHCFPLACSSATRPSALVSLVAGCAAAGCVLHCTDPAALAPAALAAMSHALTTIYGALAAALEKGNASGGKGPQVTLLGTKLNLATNSFGCVAEFTMPGSLGGSGAEFGPHGAFAGGGFGGLSGGALPGLLRSRFRPVLLPPPSLDAILSLKLLQEGFEDYTLLGAKLRLVFEALPSAALQSPSLSVGLGEQAWGLPQLMPFVVAAGILKRTSPEVSEPRLLMECLMNLVGIQLRSADALAFKTFIRDVFLSTKADPDEDPQVLRDNRFSAVVHQSTEEIGYWPQDQVSAYACQLDELATLRTSTFLVGAPGAGKTVLVQVMAATRQFVEVERQARREENAEKEGLPMPAAQGPGKVVVLPVNALTLTELYGTPDESQDNDDDDHKHGKKSKKHGDDDSSVALVPAGAKDGASTGGGGDDSASVVTAASTQKKAPVPKAKRLEPADPGMLSKVLREISLAAKKNGRPTMLVLDGDCASGGGWAEVMVGLLDQADARPEAPPRMAFLDNLSLRLPSNLNLVLEVSQLRSATPALVSRCGLLFVDDSDGFAWRCCMANWVKALPDEVYSDVAKEWISGFLEAYVPPCLRWTQKARATGAGWGSGGGSYACHPTAMALVNGLLRLLGDLIDEHPQMLRKQNHLEVAFMFCCCWAMGGHLPRAGSDLGGGSGAFAAPAGKSRGGGGGAGGGSSGGPNGTYTASAFSEWWRNEFKTTVFPRGGTIFDWWLDPTTVTFSEWSRSAYVLEPFTALKDDFDPRARHYGTMSEVVVPTGDGAATAYWLRRLLRAKHPVLVASGPGGASGKRRAFTEAFQLMSAPALTAADLALGSAALATKVKLLRATSPPKWSTCTVPLHGSISVSGLQAQVRSSLFLSGPGSLTPPIGTENVMVFVEDLSLASCGSAAVLRRLAETSQVFGESPQLHSLTVSGVALAATTSLRTTPSGAWGPTSGTSGGGRISSRGHLLAPGLGVGDSGLGLGDRGEAAGEAARLQRHFTILWKGPPGPADLQRICQTLLVLHVTKNADFPRLLKDNAEPLAKIIVATHLELCAKLRRTPNKPFLSFNLRSLQRIMDGGMLRTNPESCYTVEGMVSAYVHEAIRTYGDCCNDPHDVIKVEKVLSQQLKEKFPNVDLNKHFPLAKPTEPLIFSTCEDRLKNRGSELDYDEPRLRAVPVSYDATRSQMEQQLRRYPLTPEALAAAEGPEGFEPKRIRFDQRAPSPPTTVLFDRCIEVVLRLIRLLGAKIPLHALLVGSAGSGRKSMLRLATYLCKHDLKVVSSSANFSAIVCPALERLVFSRDPSHDDALDGDDDNAAVEAAREKAAQKKEQEANSNDKEEVPKNGGSGGGAAENDDHEDGDEDGDGEPREEHNDNDNDNDDDDDDDDDDNGGGGAGGGGEDEDEVVRDAPLPKLPILPAIVLCACDDPEAYFTHDQFLALSALLKGEVPDSLFSKDEQKRLGLGLRERVLRQRESVILEAGGKPLTQKQRLEDPWRGLSEHQLQDLCWEHFCKKVKARLRVVVVLDPGDRGSSSHQAAHTHHDPHHHGSGAAAAAVAGSEAGTPGPSEPNSAVGKEGGGGFSANKNAAHYPPVQPPEPSLWRTGDVSFRQRLRDFPALVECCSLEWLPDWPGDKNLMGAANHHLDILLMGDSLEKRALARFFAIACSSANARCQEQHRSYGGGGCEAPFGLRHIGDLVSTSYKVFEAKRHEIDDYVEQLTAGLKVMTTAEEDSVKLKTAVTELQLVVEEKHEDYENLNALMLKEEIRVDKEEAKVADFEAYVNKIQDDCDQQREVVIGDLNQAVPFLESMSAAVASIERSDVGAIAKLNKLPHEFVDDVFGALVILFAGSDGLNIKVDKNGKVGDQQRSWGSARVALLSNVNAFIDRLRGFKVLLETGDVPAINMQDVRRYLVLDHFVRAELVIEEHSSLAATLAVWANNAVSYYDVVQIVEPKRQVLRKFILQLDAARKRLAAAQESLDQQKARLAKLKRDVQVAHDQWMLAVSEAERGELRLELAEKLVSILRNEGYKWQQLMEQMDHQRELLLGDAAVASVLTHVGSAFPPETRRHLLHKQWLPFLRTCMSGRPLPHTPDTVSDPSVISLPFNGLIEWGGGFGGSAFSGTPGDGQLDVRDRDVVTSAVALTLTTRSPLLIDPQGRALRWLYAKLNKDCEDRFAAEQGLSNSGGNGSRTGTAALVPAGGVEQGISNSQNKKPGTSGGGSKPPSRQGTAGGKGKEPRKVAPTPLVIHVGEFVAQHGGGFETVAALQRGDGSSSSGSGNDGGGAEEPPVASTACLVPTLLECFAQGRPVLLVVKEWEVFDAGPLLPFFAGRTFTRVKRSPTGKVLTEASGEDGSDHSRPPSAAATTAAQETSIEGTVVVATGTQPTATEGDATNPSSTTSGEGAAPTSTRSKPATPMKSARSAKEPTPLLDHFLSLADSDNYDDTDSFSAYAPLPSNGFFFLGVHTNADHAAQFSPRLQSLCSVVHFGLSHAAVHRTATSLVLACNHPNVAERLRELVPSEQAKKRALVAYEKRLLEQLLVEEIVYDAPKEAPKELAAKDKAAEDGGEDGKEDDKEGDDGEEEEEDDMDGTKKKAREAAAKRAAEHAAEDEARTKAAAAVPSKIPITENRALIETITQTKKAEVSARKGVEEASAELVTLYSATELYRPLTARICQLYRALQQAAWVGGVDASHGGSALADDAADANQACTGGASGPQRVGAGRYGAGRHSAGSGVSSAASLYAHSFQEHLAVVAKALRAERVYLESATGKKAAKGAKGSKSGGGGGSVASSAITAGKETDIATKRANALEILCPPKGTPLPYDAFSVRLKRYIEATTTALFDLLEQRFAGKDTMAARLAAYLNLLAAVPEPEAVTTHHRHGHSRGVSRGASVAGSVAGSVAVSAAPSRRGSNSSQMEAAAAAAAASSIPAGSDATAALASLSLGSSTNHAKHAGHGHDHTDPEMDGAESAAELEGLNELVELGLGGTAQLSPSEIQCLLHPPKAADPELVSDAMAVVVNEHQWKHLAALEEVFAYGTSPLAIADNAPSGGGAGTGNNSVAPSPRGTASQPPSRPGSAIKRRSSVRGSIGGGSGHGGGHAAKGPLEGEPGYKAWFAHFKNQLIEFAEEWVLWRAATHPERTLLPGPLSEASDIDRILVLACLRPDRLVAAIRNMLDFQAPHIGHKLLTPKQRPSFATRITTLVFAKDASVPVGSTKNKKKNKDSDSTLGDTMSVGSSAPSALGAGVSDDAAAPRDSPWSPHLLSARPSVNTPRPVLALYSNDACIWELKSALAKGKPKGGGGKGGGGDSEDSDEDSGDEGGGGGGGGGGGKGKGKGGGKQAMNEVWAKGGKGETGCVAAVHQASKSGQLLLLHLCADLSPATVDALAGALSLATLAASELALKSMATPNSASAAGAGSGGGGGSSRAASFRCVLTCPLGVGWTVPAVLATTCERIVDDGEDGSDGRACFKPRLLRAWNSLSPLAVDDPPAKPVESRALFFACTALHALLSSRSRFGPRGGVIGTAASSGRGWGGSGGTFLDLALHGGSAHQPAGLNPSGFGVIGAGPLLHVPCSPGGFDAPHLQDVVSSLLHGGMNNGNVDGTAPVDWSRVKQTVLHVLLGGYHAGPSDASFIASGAGGSGGGVGGVVGNGLQGGSAWAMASAHASQILHSRIADGQTALGNGLLTIPDSRDDCCSWVDYVTHFEKMFVSGPPLTSGDGEYDMSPLLFGLDDEVDRGAQAGHGSGSAAQVVAAVRLAHHVAHSDRGHGPYGVLHPQVHGAPPGGGHALGGPSEPGTARGEGGGLNTARSGAGNTTARGEGSGGGGGNTARSGAGTARSGAGTAREGGGKKGATIGHAPGHAGWVWLKELCEAGHSELPKPIDMVGLFDRAGSLLALAKGPLVMLCLNECARFNALLQVVHADLVAMRAVLMGQADSSAALDQMLSNLLTLGAVPSSWQRLAWPIPSGGGGGGAPNYLGPVAWFHKLTQTGRQLRSWSTEGQIPKSLHWGSLLSPWGLLVSLRQVATRMAREANEGEGGAGDGHMSLPLAASSSASSAANSQAGTPQGSRPTTSSGVANDGGDDAGNGGDSGSGGGNGDDEDEENTVSRRPTVHASAGATKPIPGMEEFVFTLIASNKSDPEALPHDAIPSDGACVLVHGLSLEGALWPDAHLLGTTRGAMQYNLGGIEGLSSGGWLEPRIGSPHQQHAHGHHGHDHGSMNHGEGGHRDPRAKRLQHMPICLLSCKLPEPDPFPEDPTGNDNDEGEEGENAELLSGHMWREDSDLMALQREEKRQSVKALEASSGAGLANVALAATADGNGDDNPEGEDKGNNEEKQIEADSGSALPSRRSVRVPVYVSCDRASLVVELPLPAAVHNPNALRDWTLANPAIFLHGE